MQYMADRMAATDDAAEDQAAWMFAAVVIDRLCLWLMSAATVGCMVYVYAAAPYLNAELNQ